MIIICNEKEAKKKCLKNTFKVLISSDIMEMDKRTVRLKSLMPQMNHIIKYLDGHGCSLKKFEKEYVSHIMNDPNSRCSLLLCLMSCMQHNDLVLISSKDEYKKFKYLKFLAKIFNKGYGIDYVMFKDLDENDLDKPNDLSKKNINIIIKDFMLFGNQLFDSDESRDEFIKYFTKKYKSNKKHKNIFDDNIIEKHNLKSIVKYK